MTEQIHPKDRRYRSERAIEAFASEMRDLRERDSWGESAVIEAYKVRLIHPNAHFARIWVF